MQNLSKRVLVNHPHFSSDASMRSFYQQAARSVGFSFYEVCMTERKEKREMPANKPANRKPQLSNTTIGCIDAA